MNTLKGICKIITLQGICKTMLTPSGDQLVDIHYYGDHALYTAAENNHLDIVKYLIQQDADVESGNGYLSILFAARNGHLEMIKELLTCSNIDLNEEIRESTATDALWEAARNDHKNIVDFLISAGADIHENWNYAILCGALNNKKDMVKYLINICKTTHTPATCDYCADYVNFTEEDLEDMSKIEKDSYDKKPFNDEDHDKDANGLSILNYDKMFKRMEKYPNLYAKYKKYYGRGRN
jgi:ankyrin repeat protein